MKKIITLLVVVTSLLSISVLAGCTNKEDKCDQVAVAMLNKGILKTNVYHSKKWQNICLRYWDYEGNDAWRDCVLDAKDINSMDKCGFPTTTKPYE